MTGEVSSTVLAMGLSVSQLMLTKIATRQRILFMMSGLDVIYQLQVG